ncbi:MAG: hypothetical protein E3J64_08420, partial [Anaerolineales bacterium]
MADPLEQGIAALRAGDTAKARHHLSLAVQRAPRDEKAWLWLSGAMDSDEERLKCLKRVLSINPANVAAQRGVAEVEKRVASRRPARSAATASAKPEAPVPAVEARRRTRTRLQVKGVATAAVCLSCGAETAPGQEVPLRPRRKGGMPEVMCAKCADEPERAYQAETEKP